MRRAFLIAAALFASASAARADEILNIGDPAPKLAVSKFVKGEEVKEFEAGKTYVVEFWATWCGPCRASIPHLTELAHKYKDKGVTFIGVDVWEQDIAEVEPFLKEMGDKMDYNVALDDVPKGGDANDGKMASNWLKAAEENGIPSSFIIHDKKIAWIGHPMKMDEPLEKIVAGEWDAKPIAEKRLKAKTMERNSTKIGEAFRAHRWKETLSAIEGLGAKDNDLNPEFQAMKYAALCNSGEVDAGLELGEALFKQHKEQAGIMNALAWYVLDPENGNKIDPKVAKFALKVAERGNELTKGQHFAILDTLANAQYETGDAKAALETEEKALKRLEANVPNENHPYYAQFREAIKKFKKAAEAGK